MNNIVINICDIKMSKIIFIFVFIAYVFCELYSCLYSFIRIFFAAIWIMAPLQCFFGELAKSLDYLVTHTIYSHTVEDKDSIDPRVFDMIETENKSIQTEDEDDESNKNGYAVSILKTMDSIVVDILGARNKIPHTVNNWPSRRCTAKNGEKGQKRSKNV